MVKVQSRIWIFFNCCSVWVRWNWFFALQAFHFYYFGFTREIYEAFSKRIAVINRPVTFSLFRFFNVHFCFLIGSECIKDTYLKIRKSRYFWTRYNLYVNLKRECGTIKHELMFPSTIRLHITIQADPPQN